MNVSRSLPLMIRKGLLQLAGDNHTVISFRGTRMAIRPVSYDFYVLSEVFLEEVYTPRMIWLDCPSVIMDLGANIGAFSIWASRKWEPTSIYSVEMDAENFAFLSENIALNHLDGQVKPIQAAVWDKNGRVGIDRHNFNHGMTTVSERPTEDGILSMTLAKLFETIRVKQVNMLKMDIEGAEDKLFTKENEALFAEKIKYLVAELHPTRGVDVQRIDTYLLKLGFKVQIRKQFTRTTPMLEAVNHALLV